jgi:hypothetical protein
MTKPEPRAQSAAKEFKLVRVSQQNPLPKFRIAVLLAAAGERAEWQPSLQISKFFTGNFRANVHAWRKLRGV